MKIKPTKHERVYLSYLNNQKNILTENLTPGTRVYGEQLVTSENKEYRIWDPYRSKLAAALLLSENEIPPLIWKHVLYLGAASGTTVSHLSDIIKNDGYIYAVEFSPRSGRNLVKLAEERQNIVPIIDDARKPENYVGIVPIVDLIYQDVAQPDQTHILARNCQTFLKNGGYFILAVKTQSIDVTKTPKTVINEQVEILKNEYDLKILHIIDISTYQKAHSIIIGTNA